MASVRVFSAVGVTSEYLAGTLHHVVSNYEELMKIQRVPWQIGPQRP
jgi:hypothetical protein